MTLFQTMDAISNPVRITHHVCLTLILLSQILRGLPPEDRAALPSVLGVGGGAEQLNQRAEERARRLQAALDEAEREVIVAKAAATRAAEERAVLLVASAEQSGQIAAQQARFERLQDEV